MKLGTALAMTALMSTAAVADPAARANTADPGSAPLMRDPVIGYGQINVSARGTSDVQWSTSANGEHSRDGVSHLGTGGSLSLRMGERLRLALAPRFVIHTERRQYVATIDDAARANTTDPNSAATTAGRATTGFGMFDAAGRANTSDPGSINSGATNAAGQPANVPSAAYSGS